jgi:hypothetical protein
MSKSDKTGKVKVSEVKAVRALEDAGRVLEN